MNKNDEKLEHLAETMLSRLREWREVANRLNDKNVESHLSAEDIDAYFTSDKAFMDAKAEWEKYLRELYRLK